MTASRARSPNGINIHRFLDEFGIKVRPLRDARTPRPANVVYGGRTVSRLMRKNLEQCRTVIACIQASNPRCLDEGTVWAIWLFIDAHMAHTPRHEAVAAFRTVDLAAVAKRAQRLVAGRSGRMGRMPEKLATLLADRLIEKETA